MVDSTSYPGGELELFARATNWKRIIRRQIAPFLGDEVLEVGAGFGATTLALQDRPRRRWLCLEPDPLLGQRLATRIEHGELPAWCSLRHGTVGQLESDELFETIRILFKSCRNVVVVVEILEYLGADDRCAVDSVCVHLVDQLFD